jgi:hypothetical protein
MFGMNKELVALVLSHLLGVLIIIVDVLKRWRCSDGLAMWWWWLR